MLRVMLRRMRGVSLTETLIMMPVFLMITLGVIQFALVYEAKSSLDYATFMAARAGANDHARKGSINTGLAKSLSGLYTDGNSTTNLVKAIAKARADLIPFSRIRILNPTKEAFRDFGVQNNQQGVTEIPNEMLHLASTSKGSSSKMNIQDANLLKLEVLYGYKLKVPFVNRVITTITSWFTTDPTELAYLSQNRLPILATATVRMQTRAWDNSWVQRTSDVNKAVADSSTANTPLIIAKVQRPWSSGPTGQGNPSQVYSGNPGGTLPIGGGYGQGTPSTGGSTGSGNGSSTGNNGTGNGSPSPCNGNQTAAQSTSTQSTSAGNPIHVVTGNKYQAETDLRPLPGVLGLEFIRHYNSQQEQDGPMGYGWSHSYEVQLTALNTDSIRVKQADGRMLYFHPVNDKADQYLAQQASDGKLTRLDTGYDWVWPNGRTFQFTTEGQLIRIQERTGQSITLTYIDKQLHKVTDPQKRELVFNYYKTGRIQSIKDPAGHLYQYSYDHNNNLHSVQNPKQHTKRYHYEDQHDQHNLTGITDERGIRFATWAYDDQDRAILSTHADGVQKVTLKYGDDKTWVTNSQDVTSTFYTDNINHVPLVARVDGPGCSTCGEGDVEYQYDNRLKITEVKKNNGRKDIYKYDNQNRLVKVERSAKGLKRNLVEEYEYDTDIYPVAVIRPSIKPGAQHRIDIRYNSYGQPESITESGWKPNLDNTYSKITRGMTFSYQDSRLVSIDGPEKGNDDIKEILWNQDNYIKEIIYPNGVSERYLDYNENGLVTKLKIGNSKPISISYDETNNIKSVSANGIDIINQEYNPAGIISKKKLLGNDALLLTYDSAKRLIVEKSGGAEKQYEWAIDNKLKLVRLKVENKTVSVINYIYDKNNRLIAKKDSDGNELKTYQYNGTNKYVTSTIEGDFKNHYKYDQYGNLVSINTGNKSINFTSVNNQYLPTLLTDSRGNKTVYARDDFGQTVYTSSPDSGLTQYDYTPSGLLVKKSDANNHSVEIDYDKYSAISQLNLKDDFIKISNKNGRISIKDKHNEEIRNYDLKNHEISIQQIRSNKTYQTVYSFDELGRLESKKLPSGKILNYIYSSDYKSGDASVVIELDGLILDKEILRKSVYKDNAYYKSIIYQSSNTKYTVHKNSDKIKSISLDDDNVYHYLYNDKGKIVGVNRGKSIYKRYQYDNKGQLDFALTPYALYGYSYDENGNRIRKVVNGEHHIYQYENNSNRLTNVTSSNQKTQLRYRKDGSLKSIDGYRFTYNSNGQPIAIINKHNDKPFVQYQYNGKGERIAKEIYLPNGARQYTGYLYENHRLIAEHNKQGEITRQYIYLDGMLVSILEDDRIYYIYNNHLKAPIVVKDLEGNVIWKADYSPFGEAYVDPDPDQNGELFTLNIRMPGQYEDWETGYYYNYYRYYDPAAGRYISSDPLGQQAGANTYAYVENDPIHYYDPLGLLLFAFDGTLNTDVQSNLNKSGAAISNVVRFREAYNGDTGGVSVVRNTRGGNAISTKPLNFYYVNGIGRDDGPSGIRAPAFDDAFGYSLPARVNYMADLLLQHLDEMRKNNIYDTTLTIDVVGFSRGAAEARVFSNIVDDFIKLARQPQKTRVQYNRLARQYYFNHPVPGTWYYNQKIQQYSDVFTYLTTPCNRVNIDLNFVGLWDTVPHYGGSQSNDISQLRLDIPISANYVSHAVAANEHRAQFDMVSALPTKFNHRSKTRVERSFIGAHSDIGGGYGEGDLSDVAFMWMIEQSFNANVFVDYNIIAKKEWNIVTDPIVHDSIGANAFFTGPDRKVRYTAIGTETQKTYSGGKLSTQKASTYFDNRYITTRRAGRMGTVKLKGIDAAGDRTLVGLVGVSGPDTYQQWLKTNYGLNINISHTQLSHP